MKCDGAADLPCTRCRKAGRQCIPQGQPSIPSRQPSSRGGEEIPAPGAAGALTYSQRPSSQYHPNNGASLTLPPIASADYLSPRSNLVYHRTTNTSRSLTQQSEAREKLSDLPSIYSTSPVGGISEPSPRNTKITSPQISGKRKRVDHKHDHHLGEEVAIPKQDLQDMMHM
jgi:hypothetical protein